MTNAEFDMNRIRDALLLERPSIFYGKIRALDNALISNYKLKLSFFTCNFVKKLVK